MLKKKEQTETKELFIYFINVYQWPFYIIVIHGLKTFVLIRAVLNVTVVPKVSVLTKAVFEFNHNPQNPSSHQSSI